MTMTTLLEIGCDFREREQQAVADAINWFGDSEYTANERTLPHYRVSFVLTCLTRLVKNTEGDSQRDALSALDEINRANQRRKSCTETQ